MQSNPQIYAFQHDINRQLESKLRDLEDEVEAFPKDAPVDPRITKRIESDLDEIVDEIKELERFSRINFTGFMKVHQKHIGIELIIRVIDC